MIFSLRLSKNARRSGAKPLSAGVAATAGTRAFSWRGARFEERGFEVAPGILMSFCMRNRPVQAVSHRTVRPQFVNICLLAVLRGHPCPSAYYYRYPQKQTLGLYEIYAGHWRMFFTWDRRACKFAGFYGILADFRPNIWPDRGTRPPRTLFFGDGSCRTARRRRRFWGPGRNNCALSRNQNPPSPLF